MKSLIINLIILFVAIVLCAVFMPIGIYVAVLYAIYNRSIKYFSDVVLAIAAGLDRLGNATCGQLFNIIFTKEGRNFGYPSDTVSRVLAVNQSNLTRLGKIISTLLEKIEPGHLQKSLFDDRSGL